MNKSIALALGLGLGAVLTARAEDKVDFNKEIAPILRDACIKCHGAEKQKGKLRLDSREEVAKGGKNGAPWKAGDVAGSEAIKRITLPKDNDDRMPPEGDPLTPAQITSFKNWVAQGAAWPDGVTLASATPPPAAKAPSLPARPRPPLPTLPADFKPAAAEAGALATLAKAGVDVRPLAQNSPWREANLRLLGTNVTDQTLAPLKDVTSLVELRLGTTRVTDAGLASLRSLQNLQVLGLELTGITDAGLATVKELPNLVSLNLYGTGVTDQGLASLRGLKHLRSLYLWQTKVTPDGVKQLEAALPGLDINTGWQLPPATNAPAAAPAPKK